MEFELFEAEVVGRMQKLAAESVARKEKVKFVTVDKLLRLHSLGVEMVVLVVL